MNRPDNDDCALPLRVTVKSAMVNIVLFAIGTVVVAAVLTSYWNVADGAPNEGWRRITIIAASVVGGLCSARYGKVFWKAFFHGL